MMEMAKGVAAALKGDAGAPSGSGPLAREKRVAELNKALFAYATQVAVEAFGASLADRQEVLGALADVVIEAFAVDSAVTRALQKPDPVGEACARLYAEEAHQRAYARARAAVLGAARDPAVAARHLANLRKLCDETPGDVQGWRDAIVGPTVELGRYPLGWA
jgi:butyryl-CoA dehydrogenase